MNSDLQLDTMFPLQQGWIRWGVFSSGVAGPHGCGGRRGVLILAAELHIHACAHKNLHTYIYSGLLCGDANPGISRFLWGCSDGKINLTCDQYSYQVFLHPCSILNLHKTNPDYCKTSMHTLFFF